MSTQSGAVHCGEGEDQVPDVREMSDLEFEDYIARLRRLKGLHPELQCDCSLNFSFAPREETAYAL